MSNANSQVGIYFHIPYCVKKCPYCDFNSYALKNQSDPSIPKDTETEYVNTLIKELEFYSSKHEGLNCKTIFFGGGTPSLLKAHSVERILTRTKELFPFIDTPEITLECNPGTIAEPLASEKLQNFRRAGINRISLGAQSFSPEKLKKLGRIHSAADTKAAVVNIKTAGFDNFSLDLIFGVVGEELEAWRSDLEQVLELNPEHISAYCLTIEPGTEFGRLAKQGARLTVEEKEFAQEFRLSQELLSNNGYKQYEISNFAKSGRECRHNMSYWGRESYLGIGAGAHGFITAPAQTPWGQRWWNLPGPEKYLQQVNKQGNGSHRQEFLSQQQAEIEFFLLHLRTTKGFSLKKYRETFSRALLDTHQQCIEELSKQDLISFADESIRPTINGLLFSDTIFSRFADEVRERN